MDRKGFIGSSEISSILGLNPYQTPLQLWAIKTGLIDPPDLSENESIEWGIRHEPLIAEAFSEKNKVKLMAYKKRFVHDKHPFLTCELDQLIVGTDEMVEIKTADARMMKEWKDANQIPDYYICQVMFALGISKRRVGHIAVLIGGNRYMQKRIEFDQQFFDDMVAEAVVFWVMVQDKIQPTAIMGDDQLLAELYPSAGIEIQDVDEMNDSIRLLQETKMHIKNLEDQQEELEIGIKDRIVAEGKKIGKELLGIRTKEYIAKWTPSVSNRVDVDLMKEKGIYADYLKTSTSRRLTIVKPKGE